MLALSFYGVRVHIDGDSQAVESIAHHFAAFRSERDTREPDISIELVRGPAELRVHERMRADQVLERGIVYNSDNETYIDHHGAAVSRYDYARNRGVITAPQADDLVELGYLMTHSRIGPLLEQRGFFRVHAVGLALAGRAAIVLAPSGGGKSELALAALRSSNLALLGDDMVLVDRRGQVFPFHSPIGLRSPQAATDLGTARPFPRRHHPPKWILNVPDDSSRFAAGPIPVSLIAEVRRVNLGPSRLLPASRAQIAASLWRDLVVGLGLPQVLELVARRGARDLWALAPSAARRLDVLAALTRQAKPFTLEHFDAARSCELIGDAL